MNVGRIVVIGLVSAILLVEVVVALQACFYNAQEAEVLRKEISQPDWELSDLTHNQQAELQGYRWIDKSNGTVAIPIDRAIERFVRRQAESPATAPAENERRPRDTQP